MGMNDKSNIGSQSLPDDIASAAGMPRGTTNEQALHKATDRAQETAGSIAADAKAKSKDAAEDAQTAFKQATEKATETMEQVKNRAAAAAEDVRDRVSDTAQGLRDKASDIYGDARGWASETADGHRRRIEGIADRGSERLQQGKTSVEQFVTENPLLVGVVGVAAGLLLGALLPRTRSEDRTVGPWADEVRGQGMRYARDFTSRGREFVETALDPENLNAAVERAAASTTQASAAADRTAPRH